MSSSSNSPVIAAKDEDSHEKERVACVTNTSFSGSTIFSFIGELTS